MTDSKDEENVVKEYAAKFNNVYKNLPEARREALAKIAEFKLVAYREGALEIDPDGLPRARRLEFNMFQFCEDYQIKKASLLELNDLIASDDLNCEDLGELVQLQQDIDAYLHTNIMFIQGVMLAYMVQTYSNVLLLILLYSPKEKYKGIVFTDEMRLAAVVSLEKLQEKISDKDVDAKYWITGARYCLDEIQNTKSTTEHWFEIGTAIVASTIKVSASVAQFSPVTFVTELESSYDRLKQAIHDNKVSVPDWFRPVVMVTRYFQKTQNNFEEFSGIMPVVRKLKLVKSPELRYGLILALTRVAQKTQVKEIKAEAIKRLLRFLTIHDEQVASQLITALCSMLYLQNNNDLANITYILLKLVDTTNSLFGKQNSEYMRAELAKYTYSIANKPTPFYLYLVNYFLKDHGLIDDFGGKPTSFITLTSLHSNSIKLYTSHPNIVALLQQLDALLNITEIDIWGNTLIHAAVTGFTPELISAIMQAELKIDIDAQEFSKGNTALHLACKQGDNIAVTKLLQSRIKPKLDIQNNDGNTPLHLAASTSVIIIRALLEKGANMLAVNKAGQTPLAIAIKNDKPFIAAEFIVALKNSGRLFELNTALMYAINTQKKWDQELARNPNAAPYQTLEMILLFVQNISDIVAIKILYMMTNFDNRIQCSDRFARFHAIQQTSNKNYQNSFAAFKNYPQPTITESGSIIINGAWPNVHVNLPTEMGFSSLHLAVINDNQSKLQELIKDNANINIQTNVSCQFTPLHFAAYLLNPFIVDYLLKKKAKIDICTHHGDNALILALLSSVENNVRVPDLFILLENKVRMSSSIKQIQENLRSLRTLILNLEQDEKKNLGLAKIIKGITTSEGDVSEKLLDKACKTLRLVYVLLLFYKQDASQFKSKDSFDNNILHLAAVHCCPWICKFIYFYEPDLYWQKNCNKQYPIQCVEDDKDKVFAIFNARNIDYATLDWAGVNQVTEKQRYLEELESDLIEKTENKITLANILAKSNLKDLFERLVYLHPNTAIKKDSSYFKFPPILLAALHGHLEILKICGNLQRDTSIEALLVTDSFGNGPGHFAIINDQFEFAHKYLEILLDIYKKNSKTEIVSAPKKIPQFQQALAMTNNDGRTMLHLAAIKGCLSLVETLIDLGANHLLKDFHGDDTLQDASMRGHFPVVDFLVTHYPKSNNAKDDEGRVAFHHAVMCNYSEENRDSVKVLKILRRRQVDLDVCDLSDVTPLMIAAGNGFVEHVSVLLGNDIKNKRQANIRRKDISGKNALDYATRGKHIVIMRMLFEHNKKFGYEVSKPLYSLTDHDKLTPLLSLLKSLGQTNAPTDKLIDIFKLFIEYGSPVSERDENDSTLVHYAAMHGYYNLVLFLLNHSIGYANLGLRMRYLHADISGNTPLHYAAEHGHLNIIKLLYSWNCAINAKNSEGKTPLILSVSGNHIEVMRYFLGLLIDLTETDNNGRNYLHYFLENKNQLTLKEKDFLRLSIQLKPALLTKQEEIEGNTPLHLIGRFGNKDALQIVFETYPVHEIPDLLIIRNDHLKDGLGEFESPSHVKKNDKKEAEVENPLLDIDQTFKELWLTINREHQEHATWPGPNIMPRASHSLCCFFKFKHKRVIPSFGMSLTDESISSYN